MMTECRKHPSAVLLDGVRTRIRPKQERRGGWFCKKRGFIYEEMMNGLTWKSRMQNRPQN